MERFNTDKIENGLMCEYYSLLGALKYKKISLLEIGIGYGDSLKFWSNYFQHPESKIIGIDIRIPKVDFPENVTVYQCDQNNRSMLREIAELHGKFDVVIDDGSHRKKETETCFYTLMDYLAEGGFYVIEDWAVGYWKDKPQYLGMVELITDIIENAPQLTIEEMRITLAPSKAISFFRKGRSGWTH
jgi:cephalosporin hydroxylase